VKQFCFQKGLGLLEGLGKALIMLVCGCEYSVKFMFFSVVSSSALSESKYFVCFVLNYVAGFAPLPSPPRRSVALFKLMSCV